MRTTPRFLRWVVHLVSKIGNGNEAGDATLGKCEQNSRTSKDCHGIERGGAITRLILHQFKQKRLILMINSINMGPDIIVAARQVFINTGTNSFHQKDFRKRVHDAHGSVAVGE